MLYAIQGTDGTVFKLGVIEFALLLLEVSNVASL
jgi:hypothetical protein